jgi:hypothetical protein
MIISAAIHWIMAVAAVMLIRVLSVPAITVWICFILFVICLAGAMVLR